ncbi:MAG: polymer-forming cytoskeletal protein [Burkholderiales bacterium]|nr:polymer-forming cytoskeletal protein [Burkholderiales bacterium]
MFGRNRRAKPNGRIDTLIGAGCRVQGDVRFSGGLRIDGAVSGDVVSEDAGTLVLSEQASVHGEIRVAHAVINGKVSGPIQASESLELQAKARVSGDVAYRSLEIQAGAVVQGRLVYLADARSSEKVVPLVAGGLD